MSKNDEEVKRPLTDNFGVPAQPQMTVGTQEWQRDARRAVPDDLMQSIVSDNRRTRERSGLIPQASASASTGRGQARSQNGWVDPQPLVSGKNRYIEAQLDAQAAQDRAELERKLGRPR